MTHTQEMFHRIWIYSFVGMRLGTLYFITATPDGVTTGWPLESLTLGLDGIE